VCSAASAVLCDRQAGSSFRRSLTRRPLPLFALSSVASVSSEPRKKESANALLTGAKSIGALVAAKLRQSFEPLFLMRRLAGRYCGDLNETDEKSMYSILAPLLILGAACGLVGWAVVVLTSRIERQRREWHAKGFGHYPAAEPGALAQPNRRLRLLRSRRPKRLRERPWRRSQLYRR
jgi:hypothetical protein